MKKMNTFSNNDKIDAYLVKYGYREDPILTKIRLFSNGQHGSHMQIPEIQGQLIEILLKISKAKTAIEIGVLWGYIDLKKKILDN